MFLHVGQLREQHITKDLEQTVISMEIINMIYIVPCFNSFSEVTIHYRGSTNVNTDHEANADDFLIPVPDNALSTLQKEQINSDAPDLGEIHQV